MYCTLYIVFCSHRDVGVRCSFEDDFYDIYRALTWTVHCLGISIIFIGEVIQNSAGGQLEVGCVVNLNV
jgi:hypothetical protein